MGKWWKLIRLKSILYSFCVIGLKSLEVHVKNELGGFNYYHHLSLCNYVTIVKLITCIQEYSSFTLSLTCLHVMKESNKIVEYIPVFLNGGRSNTKHQAAASPKDHTLLKDKVMGRANGWNSFMIHDHMILSWCYSEETQNAYKMFAYNKEFRVGCCCHM